MAKKYQMNLPSIHDGHLPKIKKREKFLMILGLQDCNPCKKYVPFVLKIFEDLKIKLKDNVGYCEFSPKAKNLTEIKRLATKYFGTVNYRVPAFLYLEKGQIKISHGTIDLVKLNDHIASHFGRGQTIEDLRKIHKKRPFPGL